MASGTASTYVDSYRNPVLETGSKFDCTDKGHKFDLRKLRRRHTAVTDYNLKAVVKVTKSVEFTTDHRCLFLVSPEFNIHFHCTSVYPKIISPSISRCFLVRRYTLLVLLLGLCYALSSLRSHTWGLSIFSCFVVCRHCGLSPCLFSSRSLSGLSFVMFLPFFVLFAVLSLTGLRFLLWFCVLLRTVIL